MVYKIGNLADMKKLPNISMEAWQLLYHHARVLSTEYGEDRNVDRDDGGFVLYCTPGTKGEDIKAYFDYTAHTPEYATTYGDLCEVFYLCNNDYAVVIIMSIADAPTKILNEID